MNLTERESALCKAMQRRARVWLDTRQGDFVYNVDVPLTRAGEMIDDIVNAIVPDEPEDCCDDSDDY